MVLFLLIIKIPWSYWLQSPKAFIVPLFKMVNFKIILPRDYEDAHSTNWIILRRVGAFALLTERHKITFSFVVSLFFFPVMLRKWDKSSNITEYCLDSLIACILTPLRTLRKFCLAGYRFLTSLVIVNSACHHQTKESASFWHFLPFNYIIKGYILSLEIPFDNPEQAWWVLFVELLSCSQFLPQ